MLIAQNKIMFATFVVASALAPMSAYAEGKNEIRAVAFSEDAGTTRVVVRGAQTPTFTVYKLERPSRVVIDVPQARLAEALRGHEGASVFTPNTWAVSTIAAQQIDDGGQLVRVIVSMARPGRYDVKTEGNDVVVVVSSRDPMPNNASPEELAKAKAEAVKAMAATDVAKKEAATATADAERARKAAAEQQARAEIAQRAADAAMKSADEAKRQGQASAAEIAKAKAVAETAQQEAAKAKADAARAQADADRARLAAAEASKEARAEAAVAKAQANTATKQAALAKQQADAATKQASTAKQQADAATKQADAATKQADAANKQAAAARAQAFSMKQEADAAKAEVAHARADATAAREEADAAKRDVAMRRKEADAAKTESVRAKDDAAKTTAEIARARSEADAAKADAVRARSEAKAARTEAEAAKIAAAAERRQAEADKRQAEVDKHQAESERALAMKLQKDAKAQLASLDQKSVEVQALEDKARAAHAAAQAREQVARDSVDKANHEREVAELAAQQATAMRDRSSTKTEKMISDAKLAEDRLAAAKRAADTAETRRVAAETAAATAKKDLERTRTTLASVEGQRTAAERAASEATRKRGEAEAAASDAARRRGEAESAVAVAGKQRKEAEAAATRASQQRSEAEQQRLTAEQQRKAAEQAARDAQVARVAAEKQRTIAEAAATRAVNAKHVAEASLETLMTKRAAAEAAASQLETRSKAEAKAQAEVAAATQRKASETELAQARTQATRLAAERKLAEEDLADRRKAVAMQQAEAERLKTVAASARDAAEREEKRRASLATQRQLEEQQLAALKVKKDAVTATPVPTPAPAPILAKVAPRPVTPKAAFVKDITFKGNAGTGRVEIQMSGEGQISLGEVTANYVELIIDNAELAQKLERKLDVGKFGSPVRSISSFRDRHTANRVRLVAELASPATPTVERGVAGLSWSFAGTRTVAQAKPMRTQDIPPQVVGGFGAASTPLTQQSVTQVAPQAARNRKVYRGTTVDFNFKDAPLSELLRTIAEVGKVNIVVPEGTDAKVTVRLIKVPWDQALEVILASHGLWYRKDGNLYRIAPRKELDAEDEAEAARREAMIKAESPRSEIVALNYASAEELKPKLESMLSAKGRLEVDSRTNALIISDVGGNREQISRLALQLDTQTPQISIEARIVEARSTFLRQFGIQWGGNASASAAGGNSTGLVFPSSVGIAGGADDASTTTAGLSALPSDFAVNLPATVGTGEGGALGMSLGSVGGNFNINLRLSALEDTGTVRIISAPKITVLNNKEAKISQGVSIPISVVSAAGTQTQFVQADLSLTVTPYVSQRDCAIAMKLNVSKNEPDFVNVGARGDPTILRKEASTQMLVADGETSVLGGIYTRNTGLAYKKLPFLGDIPVIGWLFKSRRENDDRTEILVFITPKITNRALLRCQQ